MPGSDRLRLAFIGNPGNILVQRWTAYFARRGHAVSILEGFGREPSAELDERIRVIRYDARGPLRLPLASVLHARRTVRSILGELEPDVVHAHTVRPYGWQAGLAGRHPYVVSTWGSDVLIPPPGWRGRFWQRHTLSRADLVTAVSTYMRDAAVRAGARPERVVQVQFGVDSERFSPAEVDPAALRRLGLDARPFIFSPRALRPIYNHETIADAFAGLGDGYQLVMTGRNADPAYVRAILERLAQRGAAGRVRIIDDISDDDMLALFRSAGAVVSAPTSDSFPTTLLEAMACGTPIVAGDLPPIRAGLQDLVPESLVPTRDAAAIGAALRRLLELPGSERRRLALALRERAVATADYETNMRRMEGLYRELAAGQRP